MTQSSHLANFPQEIELIERANGWINFLTFQCAYARTRKCDAFLRMCHIKLGCIGHHEKACLDKMSVLANEIGMMLLLPVSGGVRLAPMNIRGDRIPVMNGWQLLSKDSNERRLHGVSEQKGRIERRKSVGSLTEADGGAKECMDIGENVIGPRIAASGNRGTAHLKPAD